VIFFFFPFLFSPVFRFIKTSQWVFRITSLAWGVKPTIFKPLPPPSLPDLDAQVSPRSFFWDFSTSLQAVRWYVRMVFLLDVHFTAVVYLWNIFFLGYLLGKGLPWGDPPRCYYYFFVLSKSFWWSTFLPGSFFAPSMAIPPTTRSHVLGGDPFFSFS